jgi:hypothetical protein
MPFPEPGHNFSRSDIEALNPGQQGCYGLFFRSVWIYIGRGDIRQRLLGHLTGDNECIDRYRPTHWKAIVTDDPERVEKELIQEYNPLCNRNAG